MYSGLDVRKGLYTKSIVSQTTQIKKIHISIINNRLKYIIGIPNVNTKLIYPINRYRFLEKYSGWKILCREAYSKWGEIARAIFCSGKTPERNIFKTRNMLEKEDTILEIS